MLVLITKNFFWLIFIGFIDISGEQADEWMKAVARIPANISPVYHILIEADKGGNGNDGDMSIDDYTMGSCPPIVPGIVK